jgi:poly-gamma-glutamate capsule biosynthesis protein CapA/YwtB (metallophosphatase superfamily)
MGPFDTLRLVRLNLRRDAAWGPLSLRASLVVLVIAAVTSCGGTGDAQLTEPSRTAPLSAEQNPTPALAAEAEPASAAPVTLAFAGDVSFEGLGDALRSGGAGLLSAIAPVLADADVTVVNLEAALGTGGTPEAKSFTFQVPPAALDVLGAAGVDVVTMANNHGMDYGVDGLEESLRIREGADVAIVGVGRDATDAYRPFVVEVRGQRVGVLAANDVFDSSLVRAWTATDDQPGIASAEELHQDRFAAEIRALRARVDTLAVYLHYGTERETCPNARQVELVELALDAGADIVVGTHAHRLQGLGYRGDRLVAYGLSNFVFRTSSEAASASGVLRVTATGRRIDGFEWRPAVIRGLVPVPLTGADADAALRRMDDLRACTDLTTEPTASEEAD